MIEREADHLGRRERLDQINLCLRVRHPHQLKITSMLASWCMPQDDPVWAAASENETRSRIGGMTRIFLQWSTSGHRWF